MKILSDWRSVRLWESRVEQELHRSHDLRLHGFAIGTTILLLMWLVSHLQMRLGVESLALRYALTLGAGYGVYLLLLRWWAGRLVQRSTNFDPDLPDPGTFEGPSAHGSGGRFDAADLPDVGGGALDLAGGLDEGAVVVVPVVAMFLIGVQTLQAGDTIGYGSSFRAEGPLRIGVAAVGYADGYPRHCSTGTPVLVNGVRTRMVGRVSMDMITVDLTPVPDAGIGSDVTLWGKAASNGALLSIDEVARCAGTVGYELMCAVARRVPMVAD